ncbi:MAG TPA: hypothetical protein VF549_14205 [Solirubrobacteraceae bacterium]|jgi:hypothetical protein
MARGSEALRAILTFTMVSTGIHFTHNFVKIEDYPESPIPDWVVRTAIVVTWPIFLVVAIRAYRSYSRGDQRGARPWLVALGLWALAALGHFTSGNPDIPPVWYATIWTDALAGFLVLGFVAWSERSAGRSAPAAG